MHIARRRQAVYGFKGADARYLTLAPRVLPGGASPFRRWESYPLRVSNRITGNMAAFLNRAVLHEEYIAARKGAGLPVVLIRGSAYRVSERLGHVIAAAIGRGGHRASDIMVINLQEQRGGRAVARERPRKRAHAGGRAARYAR
jgi:hypothetical protein